MSQHVKKAIRSYLSGHPEAADSAAGIAQWWLGELNGRVTVEDTERALAELVEAGVVERQILPDGRALYRAARPVGWS
jgi:hypothetical protein